MARLPRKKIESNYLHIIVQGINREYIYEDNRLKKAYKSILKKNLELTNNIYILAYCIMDNHMHLLLYGENINEVSKLMQKTNTSFAKLYNKINKRVGYVFRDRYYVQPILTERQLFNCIVYIHYNPIKANLINKLEHYRYSSYLEYQKPNGLITNESIKLVFGSDKDYMTSFKEIHQRKYDREEIKDMLIEKKDGSQYVKKYIEKNNKDLEEIKKDKKILKELVTELKEEYGMSLREIGLVLHCTKDKIYRIVNKKNKK